VEAKTEAPTVVVQVNTDDLAQKIQDGIAQALAKHMAGQPVAPASPAPAPVDLQQLTQAIQQAIQQAQIVPTSGGQSLGPGSSRAVSRDEPLFIPSNLVSGIVSGDLSVKTEQSEDNLEDAAKALKTLRKKKS